MVDFARTLREQKEKPWLKYIWSKRGGQDYPSDAILCDRTTGFGNPFVVGIHGDQNQCCYKFDQWIVHGTNFGNKNATPERRQWVLDNLKRLKGQNVVCWCKPKPCHTETLVRLANQE